jgi:hypothetical protein
MLRSIKNKAEQLLFVTMSLVSLYIMVARRRRYHCQWRASDCCNLHKGEEVNYILLYYIDSDKTLRRRPHPNPCNEALGGGVCSSIKTMVLEGETAPSWWGCLCACV